ncbi:hypothetical protein M1D51_12585 [Arthrobacter sp. R3-55]
MSRSKSSLHKRCPYGHVEMFDLGNATICNHVESPVIASARNSGILHAEVRAHEPGCQLLGIAPVGK